MTTIESQSAPLLPRYSNIKNREYWAVFPDGARVEVQADRTRAYPGLPSPAPSMFAFYGALSHWVAKSGHVLDVGCGSGIGTRCLLEHFEHVTGVDFHASALEFARLYAGRAQYLRGDISQGLAVDRADAAVLADVLGQLRDPDSALRNLRHALKDRATLLVAEPAAHAGQSLLVPLRRAFSKASLGSLLTRSGFTVETWLSERGSFLCCVAHRDSDPETDALVEARRELERGSPTESLGAFLRAQKSPDREIRIEALMGEAEAQFLLGRGDAAAHAYFEALKLDPQHTSAMAGLSRIAMATGSTQDALKLAVDTLERDPTNGLAALILATTVELLSHPDALNAWRIAGNLTPADPTTMIGLARVAAARKDFSVAVDALERLRAYGDEFPVHCHVNLGWLLLAQGRPGDALLEARQAQALEPGNAEARELLGTLQAQSV